MRLEYGVNLSDLTSIRLGGVASEFVSCSSIGELRSALAYAKSNGENIFILGGGSNVVFPDSGFDGLVIHIGLKGIKFSPDLVEVYAGENFDSLILKSIKKERYGLEAMSGIPGLVGAVPIQNVGAYGQSVEDTIVEVSALDIETLKVVNFSSEECKFGYRASFFKEKNKYIITKVVFKLHTELPDVVFPQLKKVLPLEYSATDVRGAVLSLRKSKSMVLSPDDPNSVSCGSFFINPIIHFNELQSFKGAPVSKISEDLYKLPAAWLIEESGFYKGFKLGKVSISKNHSLALVNNKGSTSELLKLVDLIRSGVYEKFGIELEVEPNIV